MSAKPKKRNRSAITGRFVTLVQALLHPKTTISETLKLKKKEP
jgi:hypothetical protein